MIDFSDSIAAAISGDADAYSFLYQKSYGVFYAKAAQILKSKDDIEDALQEAYIKIFRSLNSLSDAKAFFAWGKRIVTNCCIDLIQKKSRQEDNELLKPETGDDTYMGMEDLPAEEYRRSASPDMNIDAKETQRLIQSILAEVPERQRVALLLWNEGKTYKKIGEILGISEGTAKSNVFFGKKKVKEKTEQLEKEQGIRLYSLTPIAFFVWLLSEAEKQNVSAMELSKEEASAAVSGILKKAGIQSVLPKTAETVQKAGNITDDKIGHAAKTALHAAGSGAAHKIIPIVTAAAVGLASGGGIGNAVGYSHGQKEAVSLIEQEAAASQTEQTVGEAEESSAIAEESSVPEPLTSSVAETEQTDTEGEELTAGAEADNNEQTVADGCYVYGRNLAKVLAPYNTYIYEYEDDGTVLTIDGKYNFYPTENAANNSILLSEEEIMNFPVDDSTKYLSGQWDDPYVVDDKDKLFDWLDADYNATGLVVIVQNGKAVIVSATGH